MGGKYDPAVIVMMYTSPTHGANKTVRLFFCPEMGNIMELLFSHLRIYPIVNVTKCIIMFKRIKHINLKNVFHKLFKLKKTPKQQSRGKSKRK